MEAAPAATEPKSGSEQAPDEPLPAGAPEGLKRAAKREPLSDSSEERRHAVEADERESEALDFLLGPTKALEFRVPVRYDTPNGERKLVFHCRQVDGDVIRRAEDDNREGTGPFAPINQEARDAAIVAAACESIEDEGSGERIEVRSERFVGALHDPVLAMAARFKFQPGILTGVAAQVQVMAGYANDRVESAQRGMVSAAKNS